MKLRKGRYKSPPRVIRKKNQMNSNTENPNQQINESGQVDVSLEDALDKLYTDLNSVPSFSAKINEFLKTNHVHSVHKRITKKIFPRRQIIARFPFDIWMADLIEYPQYKFNNRQYVYILVLIDCFTKKVFIAPMREKTKEWSVKAFESIFHHLDEFPTHIVTDGGLGKINNKYFLLLYLLRIFQFRSEKIIYQLWYKSL